jgi:hypothetical protein
VEDVGDFRQKLYEKHRKSIGKCSKPYKNNRKSIGKCQKPIGKA